MCLTGTKLLQTPPSLSRPQPNVAIQFPVNFTNFQCNLDDVSLCALCRNFWFFTRSDALATPTSDTLYTSLGNAFCFVFTLSSSLPATHLYWILLTLLPLLHAFNVVLFKQETENYLIQRTNLIGNTVFHNTIAIFVLM